MIKMYTWFSIRAKKNDNYVCFSSFVLVIHEISSLNFIWQSLISYLQEYNIYFYAHFSMKWSKFKNAVYDVSIFGFSRGYARIYAGAGTEGIDSMSL